MGTLKANAFGLYIRYLRSTRHLTQQALAKLVHVTDKAVSKWERGLSLPDVCLFPKLAEVLSVSVADLLQQCTDEGTPSRLLMSYQAADDIRTPLHIILGCADLLEKHRNEPELFRHYLESIQISGEYLLSVFEKEENKGSLQDLLRDRTPSRHRRSASYDFAGKRFLVVEDIELNREIAAGILKETGAEVDSAADGRECLSMVEAAPAGHYDLILMDIGMPNMDGLEATRRLRRAGVSIPVVALTANVQREDRQAAIDAGMDDFAEKPIFTDRLFSTIRKCLEKGNA